MSQIKPIVAFEDFAKLDLRVAKVLEVRDHPNADKLICMTIDLGDRRQEIIAGLKGHYAPESLVGRQIIVVANIQPRKMRGLESKGMLLAATAAEGEAMRVVVLTTAQPVPAGSPVS